MKNFSEILRDLRERPEIERRRIAVVMTAILTVLVFLFWAADFRARIAHVDAERKSIVTPWRLLKNNVSAIVEGVRGAPERK